MVIKVIAAIVAALLFVSSFGLLIAGVRLLGVPGAPTGGVLSLVLSAGACTLLGWINSRSLRRAIVGTLTVFLVALPLAYLLLSPIAETLLQPLMPNVNLSLSASFSSIWFILSAILAIELVTDDIIQSGRLIYLLGGLIVSLLILLSIEFFTAGHGQSSELSLLRIMIYTPVAWGLIVAIVNFR
jgi:hypothetical protein